MYQRTFRSVRTMVRQIVAMGIIVAAAMTINVTVAGQTPADVAGDWALTVETDNGTTTPSVRLGQTGSELTGHYSSEALGEADVTGSVDGNDIRFSFEASLQGFALDVVYTGILQEDGTLSGELDLGGFGGGTFTAQRR